MSGRGLLWGALVLGAAVLLAVVAAAGAGGILYLAIYALALAPGVPLGILLFGRRHGLAWIVGGALGYFLTALAIWAVIAAHAAHALVFVIAWALVTAATWSFARGQGTIVTAPAWTRSDTLALLLTLLLVPAIAGPPFAKVGAHDLEGNQYYRAYFTADFVWHEAVTAEMQKFAMPPRNMFMPHRPLHYYWAYYLLPGAVSGSARGPLASVEDDLQVNAIATALLLVAAMFGAAWAVVPRTVPVAVSVTLAVVASSAEGIYAIGRLLHRGAPLSQLRDLNIDAISNWWFGGLRVDGLQRCFWWVPQHSTSYILGLGALAIAGVTGSSATLATQVVAGLALAGAVAFNPFVGAIFVAAWGLAMVFDAIRSRDVVPGILRAAAAALPVLLALGWSIYNQMPGRATGLLEFGLRGDASHAPLWNLVLSLGPALVLAVAGALASRDVENRGHLAPALCLGAIALVVMHVVRLSVDISWVGFRGGQLILVCAPALAASLFASVRWRPVAGWLGLAALVFGFPTLLIDTYNAQDITNLAPGPGFPWTEVVDVAHLQALDWVRRNTPPDATVQLDPLARGRTTFSIIPSFAHRRMAAGLPPTLVDEPEYHERSERVRTMFATRDPKEAWDLAHALRIDYIWVDAAERRAYPDGLPKFANAPQYFVRAFDDSEVTIYRVQ